MSEKIVQAKLVPTRSLEKTRISSLIFNFKNVELSTHLSVQSLQLYSILIPNHWIDIYLVYYAPSGSWQFKRNSTLGMAQSFAALRGNYRTWVPMDYDGDHCMSFKNFGDRGYKWDKCLRPIVFKPMIIHQFMTVSNTECPK